MEESVFLNRIKKLEKEGTIVKTFLDNGIMLNGRITEGDSEFIVLDECLINVKKLISVTPDKKPN